jgi:hypothetical protein
MYLTVVKLSTIITIQALWCTAIHDSRNLFINSEGKSDKNSDWETALSWALMAKMC